MNDVIESLSRDVIEIEGMIELGMTGRKFKLRIRKG